MRLTFPSVAKTLALLAVTLVGVAQAAAEGPLRSQLFATDAGDAYKAIEQATESKDATNAADLLEAGVATLYPHIAVACGDALATLGPDVAKQADFQKALSKVSRSKDIHAEMNLARVLGAWGDPSVDEMLGGMCLGRKSPEAQAEALMMAGYLKPSPAAPFPRTIKAVGTALKSPNASVQMAACSAAGRIGDASFFEPLGELVRRSQDRHAGLYAVWALRRMGHRGELNTFLHTLETAAKQETINGLLKAVTDLCTHDDVDALLALTRATKKDHREAACIALGLLAAEGPIIPAGPAITPKEGEPPAPAPATPPSKVVERLLEIVEKDADWEVRDAASRAIQRIGAPAHDQVVEKVPSLVGDADRDVSLAAIELCGAFKAEAAYKELYKTAVYDKDRARRIFAARALSLISPEAACDEALAGIGRDHKGKEHTLNMLRLLGYLRHEKPYLALVGFFSQEGWSEEVLKEVERALERMTGHRFGRKPERWATWYAKKRGKNPFQPHLGKYDRSKNRRDAVAKRLYGLTPDTERAVESALRWLELQQHPQGYWDGNEKGFGGVVTCEPAYTGLSLLALLGAGYNEKSGKYHETIRRAAEFLGATQFYDGGFPVTGGGDNSWIFAYLVGMGVWSLNESIAQADVPVLHGPAQRGIDYLVRVQTPGAGWRYGPRYTQSDTSCTSWITMAMKTATMLGLEVPAKAFDGIDSWLERCQYDITGQEELPEDMVTDYDKEVGAKRYFKAFTGYFELSGSEASSLQQTSMTAVGMVCRFFMGWQRSHPFMIGSANYLEGYLPQWRRGLEKGQAIAWYFYFYYYGTIAMHQMGGKYWRDWNEKIKVMLPKNQKIDPPELAGSWDPDTAVLNGGRLFSTAMGCLTLESYYRFSPLMLESDEEEAAKKKAAEAAKAAAAMDGSSMDGASMDDAAMDGASMDNPPMDGAPMDDPGMSDPGMADPGMSDPGMSDPGKKDDGMGG